MKQTIKDSMFPRPPYTTLKDKDTTDAELDHKGCNDY